MLAKEEFRKKDFPPFENYEDFLKSIKELAEEEYMLDMHVDNLLIFNPKNKHYLACHQFTTERKFMLQDKVSNRVLFYEKYKTFLNISSAGHLLGS